MGHKAYKPIAVVVADDHPMVRASISLVCRTHPRIRVVGEASTGPEAVRTCMNLDADVLVLDLVLPELDGFEVTKELKQRGAHTKILALTARDDEAALLEAMRLSMAGYLNKSTDMESLTDAIVAVAEGSRMFTPEQEKLAVAAFGESLKRSRGADADPSPLSGRELEVLRYIAEGISARTMALRMGLSLSTVEGHIYRLYRKLRVTTRVQAFSRGEELGLIGHRRGIKGFGRARIT